MGSFLAWILLYPLAGPQCNNRAKHFSNRAKEFPQPVDIIPVRNIWRHYTMKNEKLKIRYNGLAVEAFLGSKWVPVSKVMINRLLDRFTGLTWVS